MLSAKHSDSRSASDEDSQIALRSACSVAPSHGQSSSRPSSRKLPAARETPGAEGGGRGGAAGDESGNSSSVGRIAGLALAVFRARPARYASTSSPTSATG